MAIEILAEYISSTKCCISGEKYVDNSKYIEYQGGKNITLVSRWNVCKIRWSHSRLDSPWVWRRFGDTDMLVLDHWYVFSGGEGMRYDRVVCLFGGLTGMFDGRRNLNGCLFSHSRWFVQPSKLSSVRFWLMTAIQDRQATSHLTKDGNQKSVPLNLEFWFYFWVL